MKCLPCCQGCCFLPSIGLVFPVLLYVAAVTAVFFFLPRCLDDDELCSTEGVDTSILSWSTSFFVALVAMIFATHLTFTKRIIRRSGILALVFIAGAMSMEGITALLYANSGKDDGKGMLFFWILKIIQYTFLSVSLIFYGKFAWEATGRVPRKEQPCCAAQFLRLYRVLTLGSYLMLLGACIWCILDKDIHVDEQLDEYEDDPDEVPLSIQLVFYSEVAFAISYALFWIPTAQMFRVASAKYPETILKIPNSQASVLMCGLQWTLTFMYPVYVEFAFWLADRDPIEAHESLYGSVIFHLGMLLMVVCSYILSLTLTGPNPVSTRRKPATLRQEVKEAIKEVRDENKSETSESAGDKDEETGHSENSIEVEDDDSSSSESGHQRVVRIVE